jgi:hypothetical protein
LPKNEGYDELHAAICPDTWDEETLAASDATFETYRDKHGAHALQAAISSGQFTHPDGIFFGGRRATWSHHTLVEMLSNRLHGARHVAVIDYHTGLGPYGYGEPICNVDPNDASAARAKAWFGDDVTFPSGGTSTSAPIPSANGNGVRQALPGAAVTQIALEYGTLPLEDVLRALRADNWLHLHGDLSSPKGREIKAEIRAALYPDKDDWKQTVWEQAVRRQRQALNGLAES